MGTIPVSSRGIRSKGGHSSSTEVGCKPQSHGLIVSNNLKKGTSHEMFTAPFKKCFLSTYWEIPAH